MTIWSDEYCVRIVDMPHSIRALVVFDENDFANIYVNAHLSREAQRKAVLHELKHVADGDAYSEKDIRDVES